MQDLELDKKILSYALKEKKFTMELTSSITDKYFGSELQWLFRTLNQHFTDPKFKEIPTENVIREYAAKLYEDQEDIEACVKDFNDVMAVEVVPSEFHWHLDKLRVRYNTQVGKECALSIHKVFKTETDEKERIDKVNKIMRESVVSVDSIYRKQSYREGSLDESAKERAVRYKHIEENPDSARGILTGFKEFDRITNGLHKGELMIVAGSTGTGKSVVMHNIGVNAYLGGNSPFTPPETWTGLGHNILYFSLEMPKESMERRIDSCMAGIFYNQIRDGVLASEDRLKYFNTLKFQMQYQKRFHIIDMPKGATTREIELKYLEVCETKFKPDLVIIDYIGIMSPNEPGDSDWLALGKIAADLHEFSRLYEIPVITGSQVNRPKEQAGGKIDYSTNRVARSDMITNNANIIVQIACRDDEYIRTDMPIYIIKMRDGEKGSFTLSKDFGRMKVVDMVDESFAAPIDVEDDF